MGFDGNAKKTRETGGPVSYYTEYTTTNAYVEKAFGGDVNTIIVSNDSDTDTVQISYDNATLEGDIKLGESMSFNVASKSSVYVKATAGGDTVRIWGW